MLLETQGAPRRTAATRHTAGEPAGGPTSARSRARRSGITSPPPSLPLAIAVERCKGCELCVGACPKGVLALDRTFVNALGYHPVQLLDAAGCTSCAFCARVCPDSVFTVYARAKATLP